VLIHHDLNVVERILRDQLTPAYKSVWVDNEEAYESVLRFVQRFSRRWWNRSRCTRARRRFRRVASRRNWRSAAAQGVAEIGRVYRDNQTEALVAIDINTASTWASRTAWKTPSSRPTPMPSRKIVRQIRLRDLGGIIVVDFIDMDERKNRQKVMQALEECMRPTARLTRSCSFNDFGLVAITRKRVKQRPGTARCARPCSYCEGAGYVKSPQTVVSEDSGGSAEDRARGGIPRT